MSGTGGSHAQGVGVSQGERKALQDTYLKIIVLCIADAKRGIFWLESKKYSGERKSRTRKKEKKKRRKIIDAWKLEALRTGSEGSTGQRSLLMSIGD